MLPEIYFICKTSYDTRRQWANSGNAFQSLCVEIVFFLRRNFFFHHSNPKVAACKSFLRKTACCMFVMFVCKGFLKKKPAEQTAQGPTSPIGNNSELIVQSD